MSTFWVDSYLGDDANGGTAKTDAKKTLAAGLALITGTVGNILNVVAREVPYLVDSTNTLNNCAGSDYTNYGCLIQSVNYDTGAPDPDVLAIVNWEDSAVSDTAIQFTGTSDYCIVQGFDLDRTANTTSATGKKFVEVNGTSVGHIWVRSCVDRPTATARGRFFEVLTNNTNDVGRISHTYHINPQSFSGVLIPSGAACAMEFDHNILEHDGGPAGGFFFDSRGFNGVGAYPNLHHNTIIIRNLGRTLFFRGDHTAASASANISCHSNLVVELTSTRANSSFMFGSSFWEGSSWSGTLDIGYNVFLSVDTQFVWTAIQPYQVPWDYDNQDVPDDTGQTWATDTAATEVDPFNDSDTAWNWDAGGYGYTIRLSGDFRLTAYRAAGKSSSVPGAIESAPLLPQHIEFYLSGGASNTAADGSLGGVISSYDIVPDALLRNLFDDVSSSEASAGDTEYRCYYVKNASAYTWVGAEVWIGGETPSADTVLDIGLDPVGNGDGVSTGVATTIANESTAPAGVSFSHPTSSPGASIGNLAAGEVRAVWVRRTVSASATAAPSDLGLLTHSGSDT